jgi:3-hydroxy acid dehydrogenase/malonic semialdehyde reductase
MNKKNTVLITGASSGIGKATAEIFAKNGFSLFLVARRETRLELLAKELKKKFKVSVSFAKVDVSKSKQVTLFFQKYHRALSQVTILVNNAGLAKGLNSFQTFDESARNWPKAFDQMIDTNVKGLFHFSKAMLEHFLKNKNGHIINLGSVAGFYSYPKGHVYCATKAAVRHFTECLRADLLGTPIRVTEVSPGMVETEFSIVRFEDEKKAKQVYQGMNPLKAEDIAETIFWCAQRPSHVNIQEVILYPTDQASPTLVARK